MAYHPVSTTRSRNRQVENLRTSMPLNVYLFLLHQAATTGAIPLLTDQGQPSGEFSELKTSERIDTLKYLINKQMPDLKSNDALPAPGDTELLDADATANMTTEELIQTIRATSPTQAEPVDASFSSAP